ncbi:ABC transporter substrate-binding protein [Iamia sp. SCSIO 61187]|uniref:ABC transporter substrate-binding protein n=1 Tax=Iamia sp. SCSIO 61187 TaxID=2722752 RepID=UPI001C625D82|nr:ABC transporter substrate-binding protein [Iamia sp. SCSIO 61187]QYG91554.1 ABC transporter substrate-binding protein [Iamia sp. SCSIO 61187]
MDLRARPRPPRPLVLALVVLVLAALGPACSSSSSADDGSGPPEQGDGAADDAFAPVTVEHRYGSTEITERPERIVSLDLQWTDVLVALDAPPVGHLVDVTTGEALPWQEGLEGSTELVAASSADSDQLREQVLELRPDLIVVTYLVEDEGTYDDLAAIAPTIATLSDSQVDTWQGIAAVAGDVLGEPEAADGLVAQVDGAIDQVTADHPALAGKDFTFANYVPGDALYVLSDPDDGANVLFGQLGLVIAPAILDAEDDSPGRVKLSLENVDLLDADLVMVLTNGADTASIPGFADLPAVEDGASLVMDYAAAVALNTPTPLSIPYALDLLAPALAAAAT